MATAGPKAALLMSTYDYQMVMKEEYARDLGTRKLSKLSLTNAFEFSFIGTFRAAAAGGKERQLLL